MQIFCVSTSSFSEILNKIPNKGGIGNKECFIEIYKYVDENGNIIITNSLDKVPVKNRNVVSKYRIKKIDLIDVRENKSKSNAISSISDIRIIATSSLQLNDPLPEIVNLATEPEWIIANDWLKNLIEAKDIVEQIIFVANNVSIKDQRIPYYRSLLKKAIDQAYKKCNLDWVRCKNWVSQAKEVTLRFYYLIGILSRLIYKPIKDTFNEFISVAIPILNAVNYLKANLPEPIYIEVYDDSKALHKDKK